MQNKLILNPGTLRNKLQSLKKCHNLLHKQYKIIVNIYMDCNLRLCIDSAPCACCMSFINQCFIHLGCYSGQLRLKNGQVPVTDVWGLVPVLMDIKVPVPIVSFTSPG